MVLDKPLNDEDGAALERVGEIGYDGREMGRWSVGEKRKSNSDFWCGEGAAEGQPKVADGATSGGLSCFEARARHVYWFYQ